MWTNESQESYKRSLRDGSFYPVVLNGYSVRLPAETLRTMIHCTHQHASGVILDVERGHIDWMLDQLSAGGTFVDVGAATGAACIPVSRRYGSSVAIVAFEPSRTALRLLRETLTENGISGIDIRELALSDAPGSAPFSEYAPNDETPWMPEASTLGPTNGSRLAATYEACISTLDAECRTISGRAVVKIDIEGFEVKALDGGMQFIERTRPHMAIDIHGDPFGDGDTEPGVRKALESFEYKCTRTGHVTLCEPR